MRKRLIQLLQEAEGCAAYYDSEDMYEIIADYLLDNGVIVPLVKVGQTVWLIVDGFNEPQAGRVRTIVVYEDMKVYRIAVRGYYEQARTDKDIGTIVFLTREAAEEALKTRGT